MNKIKVQWFFKNYEYILGSVTMAIMLLLLFVQVVSRYIFNYAIPFTEEMALMLFVASVYLGAIGATKRKEHLKIELLISLLPPKAKVIFSILSNVAFIVANAFVIYGITFVIANLKKYGMKAPVTGIPRWIVYLFIPFSFILMSLQLVKEIIEEIKELFNCNKEVIPGGK